jgi:hypothetical protein
MGAVMLEPIFEIHTCSHVLRIYADGRVEHAAAVIPGLPYEAEIIINRIPEMIAVAIAAETKAGTRS